MDQPLLQVRALKKYFPVYSGFFRKETDCIRAVDGIDFTINHGEVLGMVGESGCGKSTAARAAIRLIEPTEGSIHFDGTDLMQLSWEQLQEVRKQVQIVFQDPYASLNPRKAVGESIGEALYYHGFATSKSEQTDAVAEVMKKVGLSPDAMHRYPHQFSGGQQQRICIGRAIAMNPKLIVCDEAVSALDVSVQAQILNLLMELKETMGLSYLFISHDLSVVRHICDKIIVLYYGKVMEYASVKEIFESPKSEYTKTLLAAIPRAEPLGVGHMTL